MLADVAWCMFCFLWHTEAECRHWQTDLLYMSPFLSHKKSVSVFRWNSDHVWRAILQLSARPTSYSAAEPAAHTRVQQWRRHESRTVVAWDPTIVMRMRSAPNIDNIIDIRIDLSWISLPYNVNKDWIHVIFMHACVRVRPRRSNDVKLKQIQVKNVSDFDDSLWGILESSSNEITINGQQRCCLLPNTKQ